MAQSGRVFAVVGLGAFGSTVARELVRFGNHVMGMDSDQARVDAMVEDLDSAMIVDARDEGALREAGLGEANVALISMSDSIEGSVLATMNAKVIGVDSVWAKATSRAHHRILSKLGVNRVIHPEEEMGRHVAQMLHNPLVRDFVSLGNGFHMVNFKVPPSLEGKNLEELSLAKKWNLRCVGVMRGTDYIGRDGEGCPLEKDDLLLLLGSRDKLRAFGASL